jgi:polyhydroxyalkanoate synthesis regulator phasin
MAQQKTDNKDLMKRLRDAGEDALQKVGDLPGGQRMLDALNGLRDRIDELQKRINGIDELEKRVTALEKKVGATATRKRTTSTDPPVSTEP